MSGSATLTTVMSSSNMNVARQTASRLHHFRCMRSDYLGELAELLANSVVEVRPGQLGELADGLLEAHLELGSRLELSGGRAVQGDLDGLAAGRVPNDQRV